MEDSVKFSVLLELYGKLLTEKQYELLDYYYNQDIGLSEIAENLQVSKAAVSDSIKKSCEAMNQLEEKLLLLKKEQQLKAFLSKHPEYENELSGLNSGKEEE